MSKKNKSKNNKIKTYYLCDALGLKYTNYNPNPIDSVIDHYDCSVRALTRAFEKDYDTVYFDLIHKAIPYRYAPNQVDIIADVIKDYGGKQLKPRVEMVCTFCARHKTGRYIIITDGHIIAYIDGVLCDNYFILSEGEDMRDVIDMYIVKYIQAVFKAPPMENKENE